LGNKKMGAKKDVRSLDDVQVGKTLAAKIRQLSQQCESDAEGSFHQTHGAPS